MATPPRLVVLLAVGHNKICQPFVAHEWETEGQEFSDKFISWKKTRETPFSVALSRWAGPFAYQDRTFSDHAKRWWSDGPGWAASPALSPRLPRRVALAPSATFVSLPRDKPASAMLWSPSPIKLERAPFRAALAPSGLWEKLSREPLAIALVAIWRHFFPMAFRRAKGGALCFWGCKAQRETAKSPLVTARLQRRFFEERTELFASASLGYSKRRFCSTGLSRIGDLRHVAHRLFPTIGWQAESFSPKMEFLHGYAPLCYTPVCERLIALQTLPATPSFLTRD